MSGTVHYSTLRAGREHLTDVLDAAAEGRPASVSRDKRTFATVDADVPNSALPPSWVQEEESPNTLKALVLRRNTAGSSWVPIAPLFRSPLTRPTVAIWGT